MTRTCASSIRHRSFLKNRQAVTLKHAHIHHSISEYLEQPQRVTLKHMRVTTFLIPNYDYFIFTHHSDLVALDSTHMTYLLQAQSALLRFTAELSQLDLLLDYSSHDYSALLIMTHYT